MSPNLKETLEYYQHQGAPSDQTALISLLTEIQQEHGGAIPAYLLTDIAGFYGIKESLLAALIRRIPRLRLSNHHLLELCAGPNCGKAAALAAHAEHLCKQHPNVTLKFVPCMRMCAKGPNLRWNGMLYHHVETDLLDQLFQTAR